MKRALAGLLLAAGAAVALSACGSSAAGRRTAVSAANHARWLPLLHVRLPLDIVGPRPDGSVVVAADRRLFLLDTDATLRPFPGRYLSPGGEEPYIALSPGGSFGIGTVYALRLRAGRGVVSITTGGAVRRFARLRAPGLIDGITFDHTGGFDHRLLVAITHGTSATIDAINAQGTITTITSRAPRVEGGIAVAPPTFGRFAGDLIASDEKSGHIFAITPSGTSALVAASGLPHGPDIGVESEAFVPPGAQDALVADRITPGNRHRGDDVVLRIRASALASAGVRPGDLLVAAEGGGLTDAVSCTAAGCTVRFVAGGPPQAHIEGHIAFDPSR